jgi:hypothetical protein
MLPPPGSSSTTSDSLPNDPSTSTCQAAMRDPADPQLDFGYSAAKQPHAHQQHHPVLLSPSPHPGCLADGLQHCV